MFWDWSQRPLALSISGLDTHVPVHVMQLHNFSGRVKIRVILAIDRHAFDRHALGMPQAQPHLAGLMAGGQLDSGCDPAVVHIGSDLEIDCAEVGRGVLHGDFPVLFQPDARRRSG